MFHSVFSSQNSCVVPLLKALVGRARQHVHRLKTELHRLRTTGMKQRMKKATANRRATGTGLGHRWPFAIWLINRGDTPGHEQPIGV